MKKLFICILCLSLCACGQQKEVVKEVQTTKIEVKVIDSYEELDKQMNALIQSTIDSLNNDKDSMNSVLSKSFSSFSNNQSRLEDWYEESEDESIYDSLLDCLFQYYLSSNPELDLIPDLIDQSLDSYYDSVIEDYDEIHDVIKSMEDEFMNIDMEEVEISFPTLYANHKSHLESFESLIDSKKKTLNQFHQEIIDSNLENIEKIYAQYK